MKLKRNFLAALTAFCLMAMCPANLLAQITYTATKGFTNISKEGYANAFDGSTSTKWCVTSANTASIYVEFNTSEPINVGSYIFTTGNDTQGQSYRNPKTWVLKGKVASGDAEWTVIDSKTNNTRMPNSNYAPVTFYLPEATATAYQYFRLEITHSAESFQLSEISLSSTACSHSSSLVHHDAVAASCQPGSIEYWSCPDCDQFYSSSTASNENKVDNIIVPASDHTYKYGICTVCGEIDPSDYDPSTVLIGGADDAAIASNASNYFLPFENYYYNATTVTLYTHDEIGVSGLISSIAYYVSSSASMIGDIKIYMKEVDATTTSLSKYFNAADAGFTLVYAHDGVTIGASTGWETYKLDTPFRYDNTKNLLIAVTRKSSKYESSLKYAYSQTSSARGISRRSDNYSSYGDLSNATDFNTYGNAYSYYPCIKMAIAKCIHEFPEDSEIAADCGNGSKSHCTKCGDLLPDGKTAATGLHDYDSNTHKCKVCNHLDETYVAYNGSAGDCEWIITKDSALVVFPSNGTSASLSYSSTKPDWCNDTTKGRIKTAKFVGQISPYTMNGMFYGCSNLKSVDFTGLNTENVTDMSYMFYCCNALTSLDLSGLNTARVTNMSSMFYGCQKLASLTFGVNFNTANVTNMNYMFYCCYALTSLDLAGFNTARVTNMSNMFNGCKVLSSLDLSGFNTANVTNMSYMFYECKVLASLDLSGFNTANVTNMYAMFYNCNALTSLDLAGFNTANVTSMTYMFDYCTKLLSLDLSNFNTAKVTDMSYMFYGCYVLKSLNLSGFNTANVKNMEYMFSYCYALTSLDLSGFNTANLTNMSCMFYYCNKLTSLTFGENFKADKVTNLSYMFYHCDSLKSIDVSNFNTANVTSMNNMFEYCTALETITFGSNYNTAKVTTMKQMYSNCRAIKSLDMSGFNTAKTTDLSYMFDECNALKSLDLSTFNTANVTTVSYMFNNCNALESITFGSKFNTPNVNYMTNTFFNCCSLKTLDLSSFNTANVSSMTALFKQCSNLESLTIGNFDMQKVTSNENYFYKTDKLKTLNIKAVPYLKDETFNTKFTGEGVVVNYQLDDNSTVYVPTAEKANNLPAATAAPTYSRQMPNEWGTIVAPFAIAYDADNTDYKLYKLTEVTDDVITFTEYADNAVIPAGTPMAIKAIGTKNASSKYDITLTASSNAVNTVITNPDAVSGITLTGVYAVTEVGNNDYIISQNAFWKASTLKADASYWGTKTAENRHVYVAPFRAYLASAGSASPSQMRIGDYSGTTAVNAVDAMISGSADYYDLSGRRLESMQPGVNIIKYSNGKTMKVVLEEGSEPVQEVRSNAAATVQTRNMVQEESIAEPAVITVESGMETMWGE